MSRLPLLDPGTLDEARLELFRSIVTGRRAGGQQHFRLQHDGGALTGPFNAMLHAPTVSTPLSRLGEALRYESELADRHREIAILTVAAARRSGYEWYAHEGVARAGGLTAPELEAIREGDPTCFTDPTEAIVLGVVSALVARHPLDDDLYSEALARLGVTALVELVILVGYYELLATMLDAFCVGVPEGRDPFG